MSSPSQTQIRTQIIEKINSIYNKYLEKSEKEKKIRAIEKIVKDLGFNLVTESIMWSKRSGEAWATLEIPSELEDKIIDTWHYIFKDYQYECGVFLVSTEDITKGKEKGYNEIIGDYWYVYEERDDGIEEGTTTYLKLGEVDVEGIKVYIYLKICDRKVEDS